jgi:hypothetical protein
MVIKLTVKGAQQVGEQERWQMKWMTHDTRVKYRRKNGVAKNSEYFSFFLTTAVP